MNNFNSYVCHLIKIIFGYISFLWETKLNSFVISFMLWNYQQKLKCATNIKFYLLIIISKFRFCIGSLRWAKETSLKFHFSGRPMQKCAYGVPLHFHTIVWPIVNLKPPSLVHVKLWYQM